MINIFAWELTVKEDNKIDIVGLMNMDPKIGFIPNSLLNLVLNKLTMDIFQVMIKMTKDYENSVAYNNNPSEIDKRVYRVIEEELVKR